MLEIVIIQTSDRPVYLIFLRGLIDMIFFVYRLNMVTGPIVKVFM